MNITIASGKGGTGKTTFSTSLSAYLSQHTTVALLDCDVEEPDANIFLKVPIERRYNVTVLIPEVDMDACTGCGRCQRACQYNAIVLIKSKPLVLPELCHSCGGCYLACSDRAIHEIERTVGIVETGAQGNISYAGGILNIGEHMATPLIDEVKKEMYSAKFRIIDAPPGSSCPVVHSMEGSDFIILVVESTPFGFHDAAIAYNVAQSLSIPCAVVVNNLIQNYEPLFSFIQKEDIPLLGVIPHDINIAKSISEGNSIEYMLSHYKALFDSVSNYISNKVIS